MLFHTFTFLVFFAIFLPIWIAARGERPRVLWLLAASWTFYGWWNPLYLVLIILSTAIDWACVLGMERTRRRRLFLSLSLATNLGLLGFYKYAGFVVDNLNALFAALGGEYTLPAPDVLLPVGISFYTFQSMSYTIDFYRGVVPAERSFIRFAAFVALFPQLVAGPIERAKDLLPQIRRPAPVRLNNLASGAALFLSGVFKKVALADALALYVDRVYADPGTAPAAALLAATFVFAWQIYFDFSGYSDMARGIARAIGFDLMVNFRRPYLATDLGDFWRRWHVSLSTWLRDYVYVPLGGNRHGAWRTRLHIALTMVISGLWHGAAWTFVVWGAIHAIARLLLRPLELAAWYRERVPAFIKRGIVFAVVTVSWIFFRASSFADATAIVSRLASFEPGPSGCPPAALIAIAVVWAAEHLRESRWAGALDTRVVRIAVVVFEILWLSLVPLSHGEAFIYFQF